MFKVLSSFPVLLLLLCGCIPMLDSKGTGSLDRSIYYNVKTNELINTYKTPINSIYFRKHKGDFTYAMEKIVFDEPTDTLILPILRDSVAFYDFRISVHLQDDHWRMQHHLDITQLPVQKKAKIFSRLTSH